MADSSKESIGSTAGLQSCRRPHLDLMNFTYLAQIRGFNKYSDNGTMHLHIVFIKIELKKVKCNEKKRPPCSI